MELKHTSQEAVIAERTVLIVPFMELKHDVSKGLRQTFKVLIVPFMELKPLLKMLS